MRSQSPVELFLGVDLTGGEHWQTATVTWTPWDETGEDVWVHTRVVVQATSQSMTVFPRATIHSPRRGVPRCLMMRGWWTWVREQGSSGEVEQAMPATGW